MQTKLQELTGGGLPTVVYCNGSTDYLSGYARSQQASRTISGDSSLTFMNIHKLN